MMKKILIGLSSLIVIVMITIYITTRPTSTEDGAYIPSPFALKLATSSTTDFDNTI
jgi:molecular chaperone Hsp31 and glyoxalase 3